MDALAPHTVPQAVATATLNGMGKKAAEGKRYFVKLSDEAKRRLDYLAVDSGYDSTEAFGGHLLTDAIDRLWQDFDPKRSPPARGKARPS